MHRRRPRKTWIASRQIVAASTRTIANVALLGDKRFLFHAADDAFIMFQVSGRSWIALAGPIGNPAHYEELAWQFREATDRHDARCVFYHVSDADLPLYVDLGLSLVKLGEEARVRLSGLQHRHQRTRRAAPRAQSRQTRRRELSRSSLRLDVPTDDRTH